MRLAVEKSYHNVVYRETIDRWNSFFDNVIGEKKQEKLLVFILEIKIVVHYFTFVPTCRFLLFVKFLLLKFKHDWCVFIAYYIWGLGARVMVFNATFNNISVIGGENHQSVASHWQTLSHNVASSTLRHERDSNSQLKWC